MYDSVSDDARAAFAESWPKYKRIAQVRPEYQHRRVRKTLKEVAESLCHFVRDVQVAKVQTDAPKAAKNTSTSLARAELVKSLLQENA